MIISRRTLLGAFVAAPAIARAQSLDLSRPVRWIVPFTPGGGSDIATRVITGFVAELPNAPRFVIDNRPGAGGNIGMAALAQSPPDGHTVGILSVATHGINPSLYPRLPFDPIADFTPICMLNLQPVVIAVKNDSAVRDLADLLARRDAEMTFASAGNGLATF